MFERTNPKFQPEVPSSRGWFSLLTPPASGAIAVTTVTGDGAIEAVLSHFKSTSFAELKSLRPRIVYYGSWVRSAATQTLDGELPLGEDLIVCRTGDDTIEVHSHSGPYAREVIHTDLRAAGLQQVDPHTAVHRQVSDGWVAEAHWAASLAETELAATYLNRQIELWQKWPAALAAQIQTQASREALRQLEASLAWRRFAEHLIKPRVVVLWGKPNVGKSSLINRLAGFERALVHEQAGTTRDVLEQRTAIGGWPVALYDTAGMRTSDDPLERVGIDFAKQLFARADLAIQICDATAGNTDLPEPLELPSTNLVAMNKCDLLPVEARHASGHHCSQGADAPVKRSATDNSSAPAIYVSAVTGEGISSLLQAIEGSLVPARPALDFPLPISAVVAERMQVICDALRQNDCERAITLLLAGAGD